MTPIYYPDRVSRPSLEKAHVLINNKICHFSQNKCDSHLEHDSKANESLFSITINQQCPDLYDDDEKNAMKVAVLDWSKVGFHNHTYV